MFAILFARRDDILNDSSFTRDREGMKEVKRDGGISLSGKTSIIASDGERELALVLSTRGRGVRQTRAGARALSTYA